MSRHAKAVAQFPLLDLRPVTPEVAVPSFLLVLPRFRGDGAGER